MDHQKSLSTGLFLLRLGIGFVFLIFGIDKLTHPMGWVLFLPAAASDILSKTHLNPYVFLRMQGILEMVIGIQLLVGIFTRLTGVLAVTTLCLIVYAVGFDPIGIRDLGLLFSGAAIVLLGPGDFSADFWLKSTMETKPSRNQGSQE